MALATSCFRSQKRSSCLQTTGGAFSCHRIVTDAVYAVARCSNLAVIPNYARAWVPLLRPWWRSSTSSFAYQWLLDHLTSRRMKWMQWMPPFWKMTFVRVIAAWSFCRDSQHSDASLRRKHLDTGGTWCEQTLRAIEIWLQRSCKSCKLLACITTKD